MEFEENWRRPLHQVVNSKAFFVSGNYIYTAERTSKLSKINIVTGEELWTVSISDTWGWLCTNNTNLYYISQSGDVSVFDIDSGQVKSKGNIDSFSPGYLTPSTEILISGGWRGYSDLVGYSAKTYEVLWTKKIKSKNLQEFSVPHALNEQLLFTANHSKKIIEILYIKDGVTRNTIALPNYLSCPDLEKSFQVINGDVTFVSNDGYIYSLSKEFSSLNVEKLQNVNIISTLPFFHKDKIIYQESSDNYCLYDRESKEILWKTKLENNFKTKVYAVELTKDKYLIGGSLGQLKVISQDGKSIGVVKSEKRITTNIIKVGNHIVYGSKSEVVSLRWK